VHTAPKSIVTTREVTTIRSPEDSVSVACPRKYHLIGFFCRMKRGEKKKKKKGKDLLKTETSGQ
jgi:hypothetical protein